MAPAASFSQGSHVPLALPHSGQPHRTWASSSCAAPQCGHAALARKPWPDTWAAVHMAPVRSPRSSDFYNSVEAVRSAARQAGPFAPSPSPQKVTGAAPPAGARSGSEGCPGPGAGAAGAARARSAGDASFPGTSQHHQPSRGVQPREAAVRSARPTGPVPVVRPPDSQIAWAKTCVTPGRRARLASQGRR